MTVSPGSTKPYATVWAVDQPSREFYRSGANLGRMRKEYESWFGLVKALDPGEAESVVLDAHAGFLREIETTAMNKSFKMVLLEAFQELDGWRASPSPRSSGRALLEDSPTPPPLARRPSRDPRRHRRRHEQGLATLLARQPGQCLDRWEPADEGKRLLPGARQNLRAPPFPSSRNGARRSRRWRRS